MQISEVTPPVAGQEPCRFPKLEECAHFHYERVQLRQISIELQPDIDSTQNLHSQPPRSGDEWFTIQVTSSQECWLIQRTYENFVMLDEQLHQCIFDRKVSQLPELKMDMAQKEDLDEILSSYLARLYSIIDNSLNCGPILNWFQLDNRGRRLLVPSEESRSINTPAVAAAYSVRKYVSQARDELSLEVGDMISVIDMAPPGESMWWRGKRGFQVGFFPQHCVHIIGDKVPRNMPLPPPVVGSLAISPIKPVLRKHGKLITFFRSFILNRPSRRRLKQSGILKERVFGCDLGEHLLNSGHEIPMVLKCCAEFIEKNGIVDGIYRLSGVTSNIQKLRNAFDEDRIPNLYTDDILQDIHSVASLLKMYFRELPNPLCTYQLYQSFVAAVQGCNSIRNKGTDNERLLKMREAVQKLPPPHFRTLEYLMRHLAKVAAHGQQTGMTTRNVAIVWAPNLLRCEELEIGGVAALQGVGVQAVVTEFLICYADLIFCDHLPNLTDTCMSEMNSTLSPKRSRPKSLTISTPTKLITLEEARNKHLLNKSDDGNYIEVGGGPKNLPKKYHTIIELPPGRKRSLTKRSPSGWRSFFSKSRNRSHGNLPKHLEISPPHELLVNSDKNIISDSELSEMKRKLRTVKSAESLTSGQSEPTPLENDVLGPLYNLNKPQGHNRSISHDSYFDNLQGSNTNSVGSLLDLSEIQLNFELEESEMRIFSEDESLVSSPKVQRESTRKMLSRARPEEYSSAANSSNPSPKKQARVVVSPDSLSRKRSRIEDQLSDIQFIDCNTPDNTCLISTTAVIHNQDDITSISNVDQYQPKNKSPRNSHAVNRHSLNFESEKMNIPKSLTEMDIKKSVSAGFNLTPTPGTPNYKPLDNFSSDTSPDLSPDVEIRYENLSQNASQYQFEEQRPKSYNSQEKHYENVSKSQSPTYENICTTISITYRSPTKISPQINTESIYEDVILNPEKAVIPTTAADLPKQEAMQPSLKTHSQEPLFELQEPHFNPQCLKEIVKSKSVNDILKSDDDHSNGFKSTTYKSIESLSSTPVSPVEPENSKKSLISPSEISLSESESTSLSLSPKHKEKLMNLLISGTEISMTELNTSSSTSPLSPMSPQKEKISNQNTSNLLFSATDNEMQLTELNTESSLSPPLSPLSPKQKTSSPKNNNTSNLFGTELSFTDINSELINSSDSPKGTPRSRESPMSPKLFDGDFLSEFGNQFSEPSQRLYDTDLSLNQFGLSSSKNETDISSNVFSLKKDSLNLATSPNLFKNENERVSEVLNSSPSPKLIKNSLNSLNSASSEEQDRTKSLELNFSGTKSMEQNFSGTKSMEQNFSGTKSMEQNFPGTKSMEQNIPRSSGTPNFEHLSWTPGTNLEQNLLSRTSGTKSLEHNLDNTSQNSSLKLSYNDKRKSCHDEILDQNEIYQQVKYFRRSIHEINTLLDLGEHKTGEQEQRLINKNEQKEDELEQNPNEQNQMESLENFDSLEAENIHIYENVELEVPKNGKELDDCRSRMHEAEPKKIDLSPETLQEIPVCSKCLPEVIEIPHHQNSVKSLTSKFESKEGKENEVIMPNKPKNYDKDGLPPCLRAKNAKNGTKSVKSNPKTDENAFATEFGRPIVQPQRRKSLDDRTSSYINSKLLIEPQQVPSKSSLDVSELEKSKGEQYPTEQKLNRERIEKYKEERRNFLREKYRSESFREDKEKILSRIKQKSFTRKSEESTSQNLDEHLMETPQKVSSSLKENEKIGFKKLSTDTISKFEDLNLLKKKNSSPLSERKNRSTLKEISDKIFDDSNGACASLNINKDDDFIRVRRGDSETTITEINKKRQTFDLVRERNAETETGRRTSLDSRTARREKVSPSYCIKDMKAIFESKSNQH